jgi:hypothetical protein
MRNNYNSGGRLIKMGKITILKLSDKASMLISFDIEVPKEARQDIANRFNEASGLQVMVVDKHVTVTIIDKKVG